MELSVNKQQKPEYYIPILHQGHQDPYINWLIQLRGYKIKNIVELNIATESVKFYIDVVEDWNSDTSANPKKVAIRLMREELAQTPKDVFLVQRCFRKAG